MKRQFLGDARDAFKWEYHDYLVKALDLSVLQIVSMMNSDDLSGEGKSHPTSFPAAPEFHAFCVHLRRSRSLYDLNHLPRLTGADYRVVIHKPDTEFTDLSREAYYADIEAETDQLVFVDPCTGFEPRYRQVKHIAFADAERILAQVSDDSVVSIYQHWQHKPFAQTLAQISERLPGYYLTYIISHPVMIVTLGKSSAAIKEVAGANASYSAKRRLKV